MEKLLHTHEYENEKEEIIRQFVDNEGVIVEQYKLELRWVKEDQFVYVGSRDHRYGEGTQRV
ncbi:hypothetical protein [Paenibacillus glacialis]|uniref:Uncharacterized protein n=1 Tax=Paenibacillus glacialis TaxID=494026 RepID=A0A168F761_9BACL|nr:hypothetical protein [Paenibacillus glacialis]OAB35928.1 hypothetical protein PGLA_21095 [Paenibacillus glacialis]